MSVCGRDTRGRGGGAVLTSSDVTLASSSEPVYECELQLEQDSEHSDSENRKIILMKRQLNEDDAVSLAPLIRTGGLKTLSILFYDVFLQFIL